MRVQDLGVYNKLFNLAVDVNKISLSFPKFELYEIGSQIRRSSNSAPANLAEGFGNKHTNIYTEKISTAQGEIRETIHHLQMAKSKNYLTEKEYAELVNRYEECSKMLYGLELAINKNSRKT